MLICALVLGGAAAPGPEPVKSGVYCFHKTGDLIVFAAEALPSHALKFGLSKWSADGQHIGVFGIAPRGTGPGITGAA